MADDKKRAKGKAANMDPRFAAVAKDPRFHKFPQSQKKVEIDPRFAGMFSNPDFQNVARVDKRGRKVKQSKTKEEMQRYYRLPEPEGVTTSQTAEAHATEPAGQGGAAPAAPADSQPALSQPLATESLPAGKAKAAGDSRHAAKLQPKLKPGKSQSINPQTAEKRSARRADDVQLADESSDESEDEVAEADRRWARMRGLGGEASSSSSEDEDIAELASEDGDIAAEEWGIGAMAANPNEAVPLVEDATHRLACVDLDWDHVRAVDILAVLRSFLPKVGSSIRQVAVHLSQYGKERLAEESRSGPQGVFLNGRSNPEATPAQVDEDSDGEGSSSGDEVDRERVAQYEKAKLRYYFAVVECSSAVAADAVYRECDGMEFEHSSNALDLRFVPDDKEFSEFEVRDAATHVPTDYVPAGFSTAALQHTNVKLTWDDDDDRRKKMLRRRVTEGELQDEDLRVFLGSDDDQEEPSQQDEPEAPAAFPAMANGSTGNHAEQADKYRQLLLGNGLKQPSRKGGKDWGAAPDDSDDKEGSSGEDNTPGAGKGEMEVTFVPGLDKLGQRLAAQKQAAKKGSETVWDAYLRKRREKRLKAKASGKRINSSDEDDEESDAEPMPGDAKDPFFQQDANPFNDPFFQDASGAAAALDSDEEEGAGPKPGRKGRKSASAADVEAAMLPAKSKQKGQQLSKEERRLAAQAERQRCAELELLLMDDTALRDAAVAGRVQQPADQPGPGGKGKASRKERIRAKKEAKKLARQADSDDDDLGIAGGRQPGVDAGDSRFQQLFTSPDFALDPTNPQFKQTASTKVLTDLVADKRAKHRDHEAPLSSNSAGVMPASAEPSLGHQGDGKASSDVRAMVAALKRKAGAQAGQQPTAVVKKRKKDRHRAT